ncbi:MAG TPA: YdbL family protein [Sphingomicrobium sp.]|nr:YdbL family protein [Sphingomicrobium sp.]
MTRLWPILAAAMAAAAVPAPAQTPAVDAARHAGQVGERFDGYMGFVVAPPATVRSQVSTINIRRRALYSNLAASKGVSPQEVGITAGCQLLARVQVGHAYMLVDGQWRRRLAGQPAPVPEYCR